MRTTRHSKWRSVWNIRRAYGWRWSFSQIALCLPSWRAFQIAIDLPISSIDRRSLSHLHMEALQVAANAFEGSNVARQQASLPCTQFQVQLLKKLLKKIRFQRRRQKQSRGANCKENLDVYEPDTSEEHVSTAFFAGTSATCSDE
ncbi:hypothetical protein Tcan_01762, partial [Toxocara canis]